MLRLRGLVMLTLKLHRPQHQPTKKPILTSFCKAALPEISTKGAQYFPVSKRCSADNDLEVSLHVAEKATACTTACPTSFLIAFPRMLLPCHQLCCLTARPVVLPAERYSSVPAPERGLATAEEGRGISREHGG